MPIDARPSALLLAPESPYPLAGGGALRTASILNYLARSYAVDLIVFRQPGALHPAKLLPPDLVRNVIVIELPAHSRVTPARVFRNAVRLGRGIPPLVDRFSGAGPALQQALAGAHYDLGVIEHSWCAPYWTQIAPVCARTVLNLHNVESVLHRRCAKCEAGPAAFAHHIFAEASTDLERAWLPRFSEVLAVSGSDAEVVRSIAPSANVSVYPNAIPAAPLPLVRGQDEAIVFSGNLEYHPNISAIRFFQSEVWPRLRARWPSLVWRLVGKNPTAVRRFVSEDKHIEIRGEVDDAIDELARARVAVAPMLAGSGTRLKILEAWAAGIPVVSTTIGAEGLPVRDKEHLLIADSAPAFANAVSRLLTCNEERAQIAAAGRALFENNFTWEAAWKTLSF